MQMVRVVDCHGNVNRIPLWGIRSENGIYDSYKRLAVRFAFHDESVFQKTPR